MIDPKLILLFAAFVACLAAINFVACLAAINIVRMLRTGIARSWLAQTATRSDQPALYWRYLYSSYAVLGFCAVTFLWAVAWPDSLR